MPDAPKNWRDIRPGPPPAAPAGAGRDWQQRAPTASEPKKARPIKLFVAGVSLFLLMVLIGVVVIWLRPLQPACIVLIGSGYEENLFLPHNAPGWNGVFNLEKHVAEQDFVMRFPWDQPSKIRRVGAPIELKAGQTWKDVWKDIPTFKEKTLILFLSLHGVADNSDAYLLANDPRAATRVSFGDILDGLKKLSDKKIVVFLDVGQIDSHWPLGILHNDFVKRLREKYDARIQAMNNVLVICSVSEDQKAWNDVLWRNSVFSHYVAEGLKGAAAKSGNERLTASRLFEYVQGKVEQWAQLNRARSQKPIMLGKPGLAETVELVHINAPYEEPAAVDPASFDAKNFEEIWRKWKELYDGASWIHSPHLWRLYQDTLLRYEQLVRAGDPTGKAQAVKDRLKNIEMKLDQSRTFEAALDCLNSCFPMPQVLGYRPRNANVQTLYDNLRRDIDEDRPKLLAEYGPRDKQYLQDRLGQLLLDQLDQERKPDWAGERAWLKKMEVELGPREPAEIHLLMMLQDVDPRLDEAALKLALRTRIQAEEAALATEKGLQSYPYSEVVFGWTKEGIEKADRVRRQGEDLLFGDPTEHEVAAGEKLTEAGREYLQLGKDAGVYRRALDVRDDVAADLPQLAQWLALAPVGGEALARTQDLGEWLGLCKNLADLNDALDSVKVPPGPEWVAGLTMHLDTVHKELRKRYGEVSRSYANVAVQRNWHEIDHALSIPPVDGDVELRLDLLRKLHKITGELHTGAPKGPVEDAAIAQRDERQKIILDGLLKPYGAPPIAVAQGVGSDEKLRDFFLGLPDTIDKKSEGRADDVASLLDAANLCRIVPAGLVDESKPFPAVDRLRRLRTQRLLMWQAERTWQDHWFMPGLSDYSTDDAAYYLPVAKTYVDCARELVKTDASRDVLLKEIDEFAGDKLNLGRLTSPPKESQYWTTELTFPLKWQVEVVGKLPKGIPMGSLSVEGQAKETRQEMAWAADLRSLTFEANLKEAEVWRNDKVRNRLVSFRGLYRGQRFDWQVDLERPDPDVIVTERPPLKSSALAVRMDPTFNYGAISIVLDNSGSMVWFPQNQEEAPKGQRRWDYALDALEKVLQKIPDKTEVSLYTFGPKPGTTDKFGGKLMVEPKPWRHTDLDDLMPRLRSMVPDSSSPIAEAVIMSMDEGFRSGYQGPKVVLVLTDGADNCSFRDSQGSFSDKEFVRSQTKLVKGKLADANDAHPDIDVVFVCFITDTDKKQKEIATEKEIATNQFGDIRNFARTRSDFIIEPKGEELGDRILEIIQPRLQLFEDGKPAPGFQKGHSVNHPTSEAVDWVPNIRPKTYQARLFRGDPSDSFKVLLDPGQNLFMVLKRENRRYYFERGVLGEQPEVKRKVRSQRKGTRPDEWLVSLLDHDFDGNQLKQLIAFENTETKSSVVKQRYPGFVWLELSATGGELKDTLRWENDPEVAAPAFRLEMPTWPNIKAQPRLSAWFWRSDREDLIDQPDRIVYPLRLGKSIPKLPGKLAVIESAQWENDKKVFAVRVNHEPGRPVFVDFEDALRPGVTVEHRFYNKANRYTAYFRGLSEVRELNVVMIDLAAFKKQAERVVFPPRDDEPLPERITAPKYLLGPGR